MITGTELYDQIDTLGGSKRETHVLQLLTTNTLSPHLKDVTITVTGKNTKGEETTIEYTVKSDYLCVGTELDYFRLPLAPLTAQKVADHFNCTLPTKRMVDQIWKSATTKLPPQPISPKPGEAPRDSSITYRRHQRMVEDKTKQIAPIDLNLYYVS